MDRQNSDDIMKFLDGMASSDDVLFGFLDEGSQSPEDYPDSGNFAAGDESDVENEAAGSNSEENRTFWHEQEQLLQVIFILINSRIKYSCLLFEKNSNFGFFFFFVGSH